MVDNNDELLSNVTITDFTVLKRSLRCEKNRKFCKIDSLGSNLY